MDIIYSYICIDIRSIQIDKDYITYIRWWKIFINSLLDKCFQCQITLFWLRKESNQIDQQRYYYFMYYIYFNYIIKSIIYIFHIILLLYYMFFNNNNWNICTYIVNTFPSNFYQCLLKRIRFIWGCMLY